MKVAYVIGRFQPFHLGHKAMVDKALEIADKVLVIIGDTGCRPDYKNPWTFLERTWMVRANYDGATNDRLRFAPVEDVPYDDDAWAEVVRDVATKVFPFDAERFLVGHKKDESSFYLEMFPDWQYVPVEPVVHEVGLLSGVISATSIRNTFFAPNGGIIGVSTATWQWLDEWRESGSGQSWRSISDERHAVIKHNNEWNCEAVRKYGGPVIAAVDALLYDDDGVLLIRRGGEVGKGALAMPGGFVDPSERLIDAALRELHEECGIKIDRKSIPRECQRMLPYDYPGRSMRGRIITNVLPLYLPDLSISDRPVPRAGDDARDAAWVALDDIRRLKREFFSDHFHIINDIINL